MYNFLKLAFVCQYHSGSTDTTPSLVFLLLETPQCGCQSRIHLIHNEIVKNCPSLPKSTTTSSSLLLQMALLFQSPGVTKTHWIEGFIYVVSVSCLQRKQQPRAHEQKDTCISTSSTMQFQHLKYLSVRWLSSCLPNPQAHKATHASFTLLAFLSVELASSFAVFISSHQIIKTLCTLELPTLYLQCSF